MLKCSKNLQNSGECGDNCLCHFIHFSIAALNLKPNPKYISMVKNVYKHAGHSSLSHIIVSIVCPSHKQLLLMTAWAPQTFTAAVSV